MLRVLPIAVALIMGLPAATWSQGNADFWGTWKLQNVDPPPTAGRGPGGGGGGGGGGAGANPNAWGAASDTVVIGQTAGEISMQTGWMEGVSTSSMAV